MDLSLLAQREDGPRIRKLPIWEKEQSPKQKKFHNSYLVNYVHEAADIAAK